MNLRHLPNAITGLRLAMAPVLFWLLWAGFYREALWVAAVAGASDAVDGLIEVDLHRLRPRKRERYLGGPVDAGPSAAGPLTASTADKATLHGQVAV